MLDSRLKKTHLPRGQTIAYSEFGDPHGVPTLYFHGFPGSRVEAAMGHEAARRHSIRIIAPDRPGYGRSSFDPVRTISDWAGTMDRFADALGLERFAVVGVSGGGPYALACAAGIPERLTQVALFCGLAPVFPAANLHGMRLPHRLGLMLARLGPCITWPAFGLGRLLVAPNGRRMVKFVTGHASGPDREVLKDERIQDILALSFEEAVRQNSLGPGLDAYLYARPWSFDLSTIPISVHAWYGLDDIIVPPAMGRYIEATVPDCRMHFCENEGHFSIVFHHLPDVFRLAREVQQ
jgi:pimeloyl-ACP methyl ester carboxylesterase